MKVYTEDKHHAVEITEINHDTQFMASAWMDNGDSWWFCIGYFKTLKGAQKSAMRQMSAHGYKITF